MARPRKPTNVLMLAGAFKKNPQRLRERFAEPKPSGPIGDPPAWMNAKERQQWHDIVSECPPGVLSNADRGIVELTVTLREAVVRRRLDVKGRALLKACYAELGMTPASRSKVKTAPKDDEKPKNEFAAV